MRLKEYISAHDLTAAAFARMVQVSERAVIKWVRGERIPRPDAMARIVKVTGGEVQPNDFFSTQANEEAA